MPFCIQKKRFRTGSHVGVGFSLHGWVFCLQCRYFKSWCGISFLWCGVSIRGAEFLVLVVRFFFCGVGFSIRGAGFLVGWFSNSRGRFLGGRVS